MFDDFDTMIQSDEFNDREYEDYLLYCAMRDDYDEQEDFQEISRRTPRIS